MDAKLEKRWKLLDADWAQTMQLLQGLTKDQFAWNPDDGQWSIDQVMDHLYKAESGSLAYLKKKTSGDAPLPQTGVVHELKWQAVKRALVSKKKWKAPAVVAAIPPVEDHDKLMSDFNTTRAECRIYVEGLDMKLRTAEVFRHPIAGRMSVYRMLDFFIYHFRHHNYQIDRILAAMKTQENV